MCRYIITVFVILSSAIVAQATPPDEIADILTRAESLYFEAKFRDAIQELLQLAANKRTAYMCAEALYFRCHRMLVSDYLTAHGHEVRHILDKNEPRLHTLMAEARIIDSQLIYRGDRLL